MNKRKQKGRKNDPTPHAMGPPWGERNKKKYENLGKVGGTVRRMTIGGAGEKVTFCVGGIIQGEPRGKPGGEFLVPSNNLNQNLPYDIKKLR